MLIEAFSQGKDPAAPDANEDRFVILPGRAYGVIDGATAKIARRYDGMLSGQYAAVLVKAELEKLLSADDAPLGDPAAIVAHVSAAIAAAYERHGVTGEMRIHPGHRFSATLALVTCADEALHLTLVGDSGARINGTRVIQIEKDLDLITSTLRQQAWPLIAAAVGDPLLRERLSRQIAFQGTRQEIAALAPHLDADMMAQVERNALAANKARLPHVAQADIENLVRGGIVNAQGGYQNEAKAQLGYSCLDGFDVPMQLVHVETFERRAVHSIELFSDGYFRRGAGFGAASWEAAFAQAERDDPEKIRDCLSPKGSTSLTLADDRTYVGVRMNPLPIGERAG